MRAIAGLLARLHLRQLWVRRLRTALALTAVAAGTALALVAGIVPSLIVLAPAIAALGAAWDGARAALVGSADPLGALGATLLLAVAWLAALLVAAIAAAWRATLVTCELLRRHPSSGRASRSARHAAP